MNPFGFIFWYYFRAPIDIIKIWVNYLNFFWTHFFSVPQILRTLFSPWKRTGDKIKRVGFDPQIFLQNFTSSLVSRFVGFLVRIVFLFVAVLIEITLLIFGIIFFVFWLFWPVVLVYLLIDKDISSSLIFGLFIVIPSACYKLSKEKPADKMTIEEVLKQKWAGNIWERLGIDHLKKPSPADIKKEDFDTALMWEVARQKEIFIKKRFWRKENLFSRRGLAQGWVYGYTPLLDRFSSDITALADYEHLIGRRAELDLLERILLKSKQSNALIVGEPGVGKMSLVQKFGRLVDSGNINSALARRRVMSVNLDEVLPEEITKLFNQAAAAGDIILVINNFHKIINFGVDITPFIEKGSFQLVAITTYNGLHNYIEKNPGLLKFFEKVEVKEPDGETTVEICRDSVREIEKDLPVRITIQAIKETVDRAEVFITDVPFPEKALDLLEESAIYAARQKKDYFVRPEHVDAVISIKTEIPIGLLEKEEEEKLLNLEELLHQRVINQNVAISDIASAMRRSRLEVSAGKRPIGSFLFIGPTGVGKTETAKALAELYFGSEERMNRFDMSEYQGHDAVSKMIGSRHSGQVGLFTTTIRENPFSLLLLDEIEKADFNVLNLFLQILEEGFLTDAFGKKVNFRNQIIIATSNAGAAFIWEEMKKESDTLAKDDNLKIRLIDHILKKGIFNPEFLNRFDSVIMFKPLREVHLIKIAELMLNSLKKRLAKKDLIFEFDRNLMNKIAKLGYDPKNGARPMRRVIQRKVEDLIAKKMLKGEIKKDIPFNITVEEI